MADRASDTGHLDEHLAEIDRLRERGKRLKRANDANHLRAVNAERDVARLRARHDEKNAEAKTKHDAIGAVVDALSDELSYEVAQSPEVQRAVRAAVEAMAGDVRFTSYLDSWWLTPSEVRHAD